MRWSDTDDELREYVKRHGIIQFLNIYFDKIKTSKDEMLKWGDEVEYTIVVRDDENKKCYLSLRGHEIVDILTEEENKYIEMSDQERGSSPAPIGSFKPEYGRHMVEGTPFKPYKGCMGCLLETELNMRLRREEINKLLKKNEHVVSLSMFPLLGAVQDLTWPPAPIGGEIAMSQFLPDAIINPHPRFGTLTRNIRERRGGHVHIVMPLYVDENTDRTIGSRVPWEKDVPPLQVDPMMIARSPTMHFTPSSAGTSGSMGTGSMLDHYMQKNRKQQQQQQGEEEETPAILMDAMGFGMGCCCLQCTFQAHDINEARKLYDHLLALCPLMMAITASTPIVRGLLADSDVRWNIVSASVDDRTPQEKTKILKSRYDSASMYISENEEAERYSDLNIAINEEVYDKLTKAGIDAVLSRHVAHLFIRDPLVIFDDALEVDDELESDHFENIQSTNWWSVRFKPPPPKSDIGWRVEFRVMEVQLTDFENAAFIVLIPLITRAMLSYNLNFYMPISMVDENMKRAHRRDGVKTQRFWFRQEIMDEKDSDGNVRPVPNPTFVERSIDEIMNGSKDSTFPGLLSYVTRYLDEMTMDVNVRMRLGRYVELVSKRASGEIMTTAAYLRKFVMEHEDYKKDSIVSPEIAYDLVKLASDVASGALNPPELLGDLRTTITSQDEKVLADACCAENMENAE